MFCSFFKKSLALVMLATSLAGGESDSSNQFSFNLFNTLHQPNSNTLFSPFSIYYNLSMVHAGSANSTAKAMTKLLYIDGDEYTQASKLAELSKQLFNPLTQDSKLILTQANAVFVHEDVELEESFKSLMDSYNSVCSLINFKDTEISRKAINSFVSVATYDKISELLKSGDISPETQLVLVNALYCKGKWRSPFNQENTTKKTFTSSKGKQIQVDMMSQKAFFKNFQDEEVEVVLLPLCDDNQGPKVSWMIVMPSCEKKPTLSLSSIENYLKKASFKYLQLELPKFSLRVHTNLSPSLKSMGMQIAFSDQADFSKMTGVQDLQISNVVHEVYFDVNESGLEAAAATASIMRANSVLAETPTAFIVDRPFYHFLIEETTGTILFHGFIDTPEQK